MHLDITFITIATLLLFAPTIAGFYPAGAYYPSVPWLTGAFGYGANIPGAGVLGFGDNFLDGEHNYGANLVGSVWTHRPGLSENILRELAMRGDSIEARTRPRPRVMTSYGHGSGPNGPYGLYFSFLDPQIERFRFSQSEAQAACSLRGMRLVSLDNAYLDQAVSSVLLDFEIPYIWTSGHRRGSDFFWLNNQPVAVDVAYNNWSPAGSVWLPQPDNAQGVEYCLAVVNNRYGDGIRWHDLRCDKKLWFVCEPKLEELAELV